MRKIRIVTQIVVLTLFVGFLYFINNQSHGYTVESEWMLRANPFTALLTFMASHSIMVSLAVTAGIIAVATVLFGRFFCGFLCPLGTLIDAVDASFFKNMRNRERKVPGYFQRIKYVIMIAFFVLSVFGALFPLYLGPLSFTTRLITIIVDPVLRVIGTDINRLVGVFSPTTSALLYSKFPTTIRLFYGVTATMIMGILVFAGGFWDRRFWCQYICPSGAFFGLLSRFSLFKRTVAESKCNTCQRCVKSCPVHAINSKDVKKTNIAECIECGVCVQLKEGCSAFSVVKPLPVSVNAGPDLKRRHIVAGAAGGLLLAPVFRANAVSKRDDTGRLIRPPGAIPENEFLAKCIGCGECMKACPTNTLQPCLFSDGMNRLYTPKIVPRIAGCEEKCHLCGHVCPTGALRKLPYEEKRFAKLGTAVLDRHRCLAWSQNKECLVCDEVCPYNAITAYVVETTKGRFKVPVVDEDLCLGCGMCEQHCPIFDTAAIVVYKFGENRKATGPYATEAQKKVTLEKRRASDSKHLGTPGSGTSSSSPYPSSESGTSDVSEGFTSGGFVDEPTESSGSDLPSGFLE
ncbi:MAG: 4Fe-4S binding protein [Chitinispirillaceae bacterium]|nr:4Fe-4S binding protein [Chitinispirillaceae bacterium]